jgi:general secretion pathway protein I
MVALAITGGLLVTVLYTLNHHLSVAGDHRARTLAQSLAREKLVEFRTAPAEGEGSFPRPHQAFGYRTEVRDTPYPGVALVQVTVKGEGQSVRIRELVRAEVLEE